MRNRIRRLAARLLCRVGLHRWATYSRPGGGGWLIECSRCGECGGYQPMAW